MFENHRKNLIQHCERSAHYFEFIKIAKKVPEACGQTVLPDISLLIGQKNGGKYQNSKIQTRHFEEFSNNVYDSCTSPSFSS